MLPEPPPESEIARVAIAFAQALARGDWSTAHAMLAPSLSNDLAPADLENAFAEMTTYWDKPTSSVRLGRADAERAYVAIYSNSASYGAVQEAVDVRVIDDDGRWLIDDIVWGRP